MCLGSAAAAQSSIDTASGWNGTETSIFWDPGARPTIGQVITAPAGNPTLQSFTAYLSFLKGTPGQFNAYVFEWDAANNRAAGSPLFASETLTAPSLSDFEETKIDTGDLILVPGKQYVIALSTLGITQRRYQERLGTVSGDVYAGGELVSNDNRTDIAALATTTWGSVSDSDLAFIAQFLSGLSGARTGDQLAVENALNGDFSDPTITAALAGLSDEQRRTAYDQIAGQLYSNGPAAASRAAIGLLQYMLSGNASFSSGSGVSPTAYAPTAFAPTAFASNERYALAPAEAMAAEMGGALASMQKSSFLSDVALFAGIHGDRTEVDGDAAAAGWSSHSVGFVAGAELRLDRLLPGSRAVLGIGGGFTATNASGTGTGQSLDVGSWQVGVYGRAGASPIESGFAASAGFGYSHESYDSRRDLDFAGLTARAGYDGDSVSGTAELRYGFDLLGSGIVVAPTIGAGGTISGHESFTESGAGALSLSSGSATYEQGSARIGLRVARAFSAGSTLLMPQLGLFYERAFGDVTPTSSMTLAGSSTSIAVQGPDEARDRAHLTGGLDASISNRVTLQLSGDTVLSKDRTSFAGSGRFKFSF